MTTSYFWMNIFRVSSTCPRGNNSKESIHLVVYPVNPSHLYSDVSNLWCIYLYYNYVCNYVFVYLLCIWKVRTYMIQFICMYLCMYIHMYECTYIYLYAWNYVCIYISLFYAWNYFMWDGFLWGDYNEVSKKFKRSHSLQDEGWLQGNYISLRFPQRAVLIF